MWHQTVFSHQSNCRQIKKKKIEWKHEGQQGFKDLLPLLHLRKVGLGISFSNNLQ